MDDDGNGNRLQSPKPERLRTMVDSGVTMSEPPFVKRGLWVQIPPSALDEATKRFMHRPRPSRCIAVTTALEQARKAELQAGNLAAAIDEAFGNYPTPDKAEPADARRRDGPRQLEESWNG